LAITLAVPVLALALACGGIGAQGATTPSRNTASAPTESPSDSTRPPQGTETPTLLPIATPPKDPHNPTAAPDALTLERVYEDLDFSRLTNLVQTGDKLFVTEQKGRIISFPIGQEAAHADVYLDIRDRVSDAGNEEGLLGLAFDPDFDSNGHFFVYYSAAQPRRSVVSRFTANGSMADPESELVVMEVPQPFQNHNGGQIAFGPDGMLYIGLGDGGSGGDPQGNGQDPSTMLGTVLRIDVSGVGPGSGYSVPPGNPFVGNADARGEIWAYGFRNPWRFSFDRQTGGLWVGDVGQNSFEEINLVSPGGNYGWNTLEGSHCFSPRAGCDPSGTEFPVIEYGSDKGCSVIGGYVYRGADIPSLAGTYLYGDYCSGEVHGFRFEQGKAVARWLLVDSGVNITSFGEDAQGEIYALSEEGRIYRLKANH